MISAHDPNYGELHAAILAATHLDNNHPEAPYSGVSALFNGDLYSGIPQWAPREDWVVKSVYEIEHEPRVQASLEHMEHKFKAFFRVGWLNPHFDGLRDKWDKRLKDEDPLLRELAETALLTMVDYLHSQEIRNI